MIADARSLPFADGGFDAVVFGFISSSHNPLGTLLSPRGLRSAADVVRRAR